MNQITIENQTVKIGDVFVYSWGYEQTNINFSKVVGFSASGKSARIVPIGCKVVEDDTQAMTRRVLPDIDSITGKQKTVRLGVWHNHLEAGNGNWLWDGKVEMETYYG